MCRHNQIRIDNEIIKCENCRKKWHKESEVFIWKAKL